MDGREELLWEGVVWAREWPQNLRLPFPEGDLTLAIESSGGLTGAAYFNAASVQTGEPLVLRLD